MCSQYHQRKAEEHERARSVRYCHIQMARRFAAANRFTLGGGGWINGPNGDPDRQGWKPFFLAHEREIREFEQDRKVKH